MEENRKFSRLQIGEWRQFNTIDIEFHDRLTVITGINGAGKSTLMSILNKHLGAHRPYYGVPFRLNGQNIILNGLHRLKKLLPWKNSEEETRQHIGEIVYSGNEKSRISVDRNTSLTFDLHLERQQQMFGFHMPSHRLMPSYQSVQPSPFGGSAPNAAFNRLISLTYAGYRGEHAGSILANLKQLIYDWATAGEGNSFTEPVLDQAEAYRGLQEIFQKVLPKDIGFRKFKIQPPDILLETDSGTFLIDAASGGLATLIEITALIYTCALQDHMKGKSFVVTFDEPENHLHPSLQRSLLPTLVSAFPQVQFIVATHSPFMVSSLRDSNVYVLRHAQMEVAALPTGYAPASHWVSSVKLDYVNRAGPAGEILRDVLGVPVTLPEWVEAQLETIVAKYDDRAVDDGVIQELRQDINAVGLKDLFSEAVTKLARTR